MAVTQSLYCKKRDVKSRGYLNELKRQGWVPAVVYGKDEKNLAIAVKSKDLSKGFKESGARGVFSLDIEGEKNPFNVLFREIQKDPISGEIVHVDFMTVKMDEKVHSTISIQILGEDELSAKGKALQILNRDIQIFCLPADIPEHLTIKVSGLDIGDKITAGEVEFPAGVELIDDAETVIVNVLAPTKAEETIESAELEESSAKDD